MDWVWQMYLAAIVGSVFAVFWPYLIRLFRRLAPGPLYVFDSSAPGYALWIVLGVLIGAVVAGLSFVTFLGTPENQKALKDMGVVAYFAAFTAGFGAGSFIEEPLKRPSVIRGP